jgi:hypothetical protein
MKKIFGFEISLVISVLVFSFSSCSKKDGVASIPAPVPVPPPVVTPIPTLTWTITPTDPQCLDTAWYGDTKTVTYTTTNADSVIITGNSTKAVSGSFQTSILTSLVTYTATAYGKGGTITNSKSIPVYTQLRT